MGGQVEVEGGGEGGGKGCGGSRRWAMMALFVLKEAMRGNSNRVRWTCGACGRLETVGKVNDR